tara:strand:+ start:321 stop:1022 length:702 start_codon:yes stop_codon:yes gene_type:complete
MQLLNINETNTKIRKSANGTIYRIASLSLYPDILTCPGSALADCMDACLKSAGRGCMSNVIAARQSKTDLYHSDPERFFELLNDQLFAFERSCARQGKTPLARLNTISDIPFEKHGIPQAHPNIGLYDYTKLAARLGRTPDNYKLMFSYSAEPKYQNSVAKALKTNCPIAVVFRGGLPERFLDRPVIDGDKSDIVNFNAGAVVLGLKLKGPRRIQNMKTNFIVDNPELERIAA